MTRHEKWQEQLKREPGNETVVFPTRAAAAAYARRAAQVRGVQTWAAPVEDADGMFSVPRLVLPDMAAREQPGEVRRARV
jgi:hypothetical protein